MGPTPTSAPMLIPVRRLDFLRILRNRMRASVLSYVTDDARRGRCGVHESVCSRLLSTGAANVFGEIRESLCVSFRSLSAGKEKAIEQVFEW
jgi:hypothetical protein